MSCVMGCFLSKNRICNMDEGLQRRLNLFSSTSTNVPKEGVTAPLNYDNGSC